MICSNESSQLAFSSFICMCKAISAMGSNWKKGNDVSSTACAALPADVWLPLRFATQCFETSLKDSEDIDTGFVQTKCSVGNLVYYTQQAACCKYQRDVFNWLSSIDFSLLLEGIEPFTKEPKVCRGSAVPSGGHSCKTDMHT